MFVLVLSLVLAQGPQEAPPKNVDAIIQARDRALIRDLDEYARAHPKADDVDQAFFTIFDRTIEHEWYAEVEPIAARYLAEKPDGPSEPGARFTLAMARARAGKFGEGLLELRKLVNGQKATGDSAFAMSATNAFIAAAIAASQSEPALGACDALGAAFPQTEDVRLLVNGTKARLELVGKAAPALPAIDDIEGKPVRLGDYRGKWLLIDFWSAQAAPWMSDLAALQTVHEKYKSKGLEILGVNMGETREAVADLARVRKVRWRQVVAASASEDAFAPFHLLNVPSSVLIDPQGKVVRLDLRGATLEDALKSLMR